MRDEPESLPKAVLAENLRTHWGIDVVGLEYAPVGAGSYHWTAQDTAGRRWFVTADNLLALGTQDTDDPDLAMDGLRAAYETATALRDAGLPFVVASTAATDGRVIARILPEWAVAVFPFIEGESGLFGEWSDAARRAAAARIVGQLHRATPPSMIRRWEYDVPHRGILVAAVRDLEQAWNAGPYGERTRRLLSAGRDRIGAMLGRYDSLAAAVARSEEPWVVTHGEPHSGNFMTSERGEMYLIDWDTVRLGPRERDLAIVADNDAEALAAYRAQTGPVEPRPEAMELFRLRWTLADICVYVRRFREPHADSEDDRASWDELSHYLA